MDHRTVPPWRQTVRRRIIVAAAGMFLWAVAVEARLVYLQVARHGDLEARAERQQLQTVEAPAKRGAILDRTGRVLAYSVETDSIYAIPNEIADPASTAAALCAAFEDCSTKEQRTLAEKLATRRRLTPSGPLNVHFAYVRRKVLPEQSRRAAALELEGIGFMQEDRRFYPNRELGAHVLGYVGTDNEGLGGIEAAYDDLIKGRPGTVLIQTDARRRAFSRFERPPTTGATLELTIDRYLQHIAQRELDQAVRQHDAIGGSVVVLDPHTGEILALANAPTFNPNAFGLAGAEARRNRATQDVYEPGSTFKIITGAAALEERVVRPDEPIDVSAGMIRFGSRVIEDDHRFGVLSFSDVVAHSSNVGFVKVGLRLGAERLNLYANRFGFGRRLSPDFRGENAGIVWPSAKMDDSALASVAIGYQIAVTPLQMAAAVSAVANGGERIQPRAVRAVIRDGARRVVPKSIERRIIGAGTAATLTQMLEGVVEHGTGERAQIPGYTIAGKTGTARKVIDGKYSSTSFYASFVGFAPSRKPVVTVAVVIDSPRTGSYYGGSVAAPVFQNIVDAALRYYAVPRTLNPPPAVLVTRGAGVGPRTEVARGIVTVSSQAARGEAVAPEFLGMNARDALRGVAKLGLTARLLGEGLVARQSPEAGSSLEPGSVFTLWLQREPVFAARQEP